MFLSVFFSVVCSTNIFPYLVVTVALFMSMQMIVTDIYNHRFHRIFATNENLSSIMERDDIYVWVAVVKAVATQEPWVWCSWSKHVDV